MSIALLVNNFPPEIGSAADLFYQLALILEKRGHRINVFTTETRYYNLGSRSMKKFQSWKSQKGKRLFWNVEQVRPRLTVYRIRLLPLIYPRSGQSAFFRELEHVFQPIMFSMMMNRIASSDFIIVYSPPLLLGYLGSILGKLLNIKTIINVQDIHPAAIVDLGLLKNPFLISFFKKMERQMYKYANAIVVHSTGNKKVVLKHGADPQKLFEISNICRIPSDELLRKRRKFKKEYSLEDKFSVTYAGIMSFSQDLETIVMAAKLLSDELENLVFILAGDGPQRRALELLTKKLEVPNVLFLPFQEGEDYWRLLSASDVCLVSLKKSKVKTPVVPKKLEDIMASGRPVIANVPLEGDVRKIIEKANCGITIEAENPRGLAKAIQEMRNRGEDIWSHYGRNGRSYAIQNFSPQEVGIQYETLFASLRES